MHTQCMQSIAPHTLFKTEMNTNTHRKGLNDINNKHNKRQTD